MKVMFRQLTPRISLVLLLLFSGCISESTDRLSESNKVFSFTVAADMRQFAGSQYQSSQYFWGTLEAIQAIGKGSFMVSPGDNDPPQDVYDTIKKILGEDYLWYPVVGNHERETPEDMAWLRDWGNKEIQHLVHRGPANGEETTYSFDFMNAHFVVINQHYDGKSDTAINGDISEPLYNWLEDDLSTNKKSFVFVFGHKPIISMPDFDNGRMRHKGDNLDAFPENSHRFQKLLHRYSITAYICGHTHNFSFTKINGLWQIDAGHSRGIGDTGAQSTFLKILVGESNCLIEVYRDDGNGGPYTLAHTIVLD